MGSFNSNSDIEDIKPVFEAFNAIHIKKINSEEILNCLIMILRIIMKYMVRLVRKSC